MAIMATLAAIDLLMDYCLVMDCGNKSGNEAHPHVLLHAVAAVVG